MNGKPIRNRNGKHIRNRNRKPIKNKKRSMPGTGTGSTIATESEAHQEQEREAHQEQEKESRQRNRNGKLVRNRMGSVKDREKDIAVTFSYMAVSLTKGVGKFATGAHCRDRIRLIYCMGKLSLICLTRKRRKKSVLT